MKDNHLFLAFREGSEEAFRTLVERYEKRAYWVAFHIVHNPEDARDVVQDALVKVVRSAAAFDPSQDFRTWFFRIVSNTAIDLWRKSRKQAAVGLEDLGDAQDRGAPPHQEMDRRDLQELIAGTMEALPPKYRQAIVLRDIEGLSCKDIAQALGLTHATARWRLHHARKLFAEAWERKGHPPAEEILGDSSNRPVRGP